MSLLIKITAFMLTNSAMKTEYMEQNHNLVLPLISTKQKA